MQGKGGLAGIGLIALLVIFVAPEVYTLFFSSHPIEDGTEMIFMVDEVLDKAKEQSYAVRLRFRQKSQDVFRLDIMSPHGARSLNLFADSLEPTADRDNDHLEFPAESMEVRPGVIWLAPDRRGAGKNCLAGVVMGLDSFQGRRAWKVVHPEGMVYFEEETGLLTGIELEYGRSSVRGRLRQVR